MENTLNLDEVKSPPRKVIIAGKEYTFGELTVGQAEALKEKLPNKPGKLLEFSEMVEILVTAIPVEREVLMGLEGKQVKKLLWFVLRMEKKKKKATTPKKLPASPASTG